MRAIAIVLLLLACKKHEAQPEPDPTPTTGARGHSVTKIEEDPEHHEAGEAKHVGSAEAEIDAGTADGKNRPAYRDEQNHVHGPGGAIFMGRGDDCTTERDHCLRDGVWFASGPYRPGALFRATPVFEFESKVWTFRGEEVPSDSFTYLFKTKVASTSDVTVGEPVVWLIKEASDNKVFLNNENDALTSSRWEVGVVESVGSDFIRVKGWDTNIPIGTVRAITEKKKSG